jgi:hypothetical protein
MGNDLWYDLRFRDARDSQNIRLGDIVYAPVPGMDVVILNSYDMAYELLSKRPNSTGGRRTGYMVLELLVACLTREFL